jgi:hypothetical protein
MSAGKSNLLSKKVIVVAILAAGAVAAILIVAPSISQAAAQQLERKMMMMWSSQGMPKINGSTSVADGAGNFINENVKVSFVAAAQTAQGQVTNGTVVAGHLDVVPGYLVYMFFVADTGNQTGHLVLVDTGNGNVLYTSAAQPLGIFGHLSTFGNWRGHGYGEWWG